MTYHTLRLELESHVARLTVHRPERRNAINLQAMEELADVLSRLERNPDLRCLIFSGAGDDAFVSGGDLKELKNLRSHDEALMMNRRMGQVLRRLELLGCPVLMAINGIAVGGGCEISLAGDRRLMAAEATLSFRQVTLGLTCGWGGMTRLERLVGRSKAFQILLLEDTLSAERALALGVVDEVLPRAELMERAETIARTFAQMPPLALKSVKRGLSRLGEMPFDQAIDYEAELFARTWASEDHWEAVDAFFSRRPPVFQGK